MHILLYTAVIFAIFLSGLLLYAKIAASILIAVSLAFSLYRYVLLRHLHSIVAIRYREPTWLLGLRSEEQVHAKVNGYVLVTSFLLVINFVDEQGRRFAVPMFKDSISDKQYRQSRVFFNVQGGTE